MQHSKVATGFGTSLLDVAKAVENDKDISEPIVKVCSWKCLQYVERSQGSFKTLKSLIKILPESLNRFLTDLRGA